MAILCTKRSSPKVLTNLCFYKTCHKLSVTQMLNILVACVSRDARRFLVSSSSQSKISHRYLLTQYKPNSSTKNRIRTLRPNLRVSYIVFLALAVRTTKRKHMIDIECLIKLKISTIHTSHRYRRDRIIVTLL